MNFQKFQKLVEDRTGFKTMESPTASGEYFSDSCGDLYTFFLKVGPDDVIEDVSYFTTGCGDMVVNGEPREIPVPDTDVRIVLLHGGASWPLASFRVASPISTTSPSGSRRNP